MSSARSSPSDRPILQVGATGYLGGLVLRQLLSRGKRVRALVRPGSDAGALLTDRVEVVRGDLLDPASLTEALRGVSAVVTTAIGYSQRREGDSLTTDREGNRNLIDAAHEAAVPRFVLMSILACDLAPDVPHFWAKKEAEDRLREQGVPFVALRPGAFLSAPPGGFGEMVRRGLENGQVFGMTPAGIRITYIDPTEVARAIALAVDEPRAIGQTIDLGSDRPVSGPELAELFGRLLGRPMGMAPFPGGRRNDDLEAMVRFFQSGKYVADTRRQAELFGRLLGRPMGMAPFPGGRRNDDLEAMVRFFQSGKYVADTRRQAELFGPVPKIEDAARKMLTDLRLLPTVR
jgi:uncharacterized protein YbjT (DUF2867 family)